MDNVILSSPILLEEGTFEMKTLSLEEAAEWAKSENPKNFCGHQTTKALGIEPSSSREACVRYDQALCLKPKGRMEFGKEYSVQEILSIGVSFQLITKIS
jgi:hypothetical protein